MPLLITEMVLDTAKLLSLVDAGASGDEDTRPAIVLFKRRKQAMQMNDEQRIAVAKIMKQVSLAKMGVSEVVVALDELGLKPEQRNEVLKLMEAMMGAPEEAPAEAPEAPAEKQDEEEPKPEAPAAPAEKEEDEEMQKRADELKVELAKRDEKIKKLEDAAELVELQKRASALPFLPADEAQTIEILKSIGKDKAGAEFLARVNKAMESSPRLAEYGVTQVGDESSATVTLAKRVKKLMDDDPKLTKNKAEAIAFRNDQKLYTAVLAERN